MVAAGGGASQSVVYFSDMITTLITMITTLPMI